MNRVPPEKNYRALPRHLLIIEVFIIQPTADYILVVKCAVICYTGKIYSYQRR
jgi:hypothetical protein